MNPRKCQSWSCQSKKFIYSCTKCSENFCSKHILKLQEKGKKIDSSQAICACCFFGLKRKTKFVDPILPDPLAEALLKKDSGFRRKVFKASISYHAAVDRALEKEGYFYPTMAPRPEKEIKDFMEKHSKTPEQNAAENSFWNGTTGDTSRPHLEGV